MNLELKPMYHTPQEKAIERGKRDYKRGLTKDQNPFTHEKLNWLESFWDTGWTSAEKRKQGSKLTNLTEN